MDLLSTGNHGYTGALSGTDHLRHPEYDYPDRHTGTARIFSLHANNFLQGFS